MNPFMYLVAFVLVILGLLALGVVEGQKIADAFQEKCEAKGGMVIETPRSYICIAKNSIIK